MVEGSASRNGLYSITQDFLNSLPEQFGAIETEWARAWRENWEPVAVQRIVQLLHSLDRTAASLGFEKIAKAATQLQNRIQAGKDGAAPEEFFKQLEVDMQSLRQAIYTDQQIELDASKEQFDLADLSFGTQQEKRADRLIYMVEDDPVQAEELSEQIGYFGYTVQVFPNPEKLEQGLHHVLPIAILMDVHFTEDSLSGMESVSALREKFSSLPPIIFITINDQMAYRLQAVRVGGEAYFTKPVDVGALVDVLDRMALHLDLPPFRVLVVDASRVQARFTAMQLKKAGMVTDAVSDPFEVIDHMITFNPDLLLLLDVNMPGFTGVELAKVIRQMEQFISVPIVFLSAETDKQKQQAILGIGGDDFLTKPIDTEHLISAVSTRIKRYRKLRTLMIQDGLTGLLNHSTTKERLGYEINRSSRQKTPMSYAMIDLDHFKMVNDTYGHATGDRVLKSLAYLLKRRLRRTDTIGRVGGEEFAILFPDTNEKTAVKVMQELAEGFARVHHYSGDQEFSVTFSCGVAAYPDYDDANSLSRAADRALYTAKASGRNRVVPASECDQGETALNGRHSFRPTYAREQRAWPFDRRLNSRVQRVEADLAHTLEVLSVLGRISQAISNQQDLSRLVTEVSIEMAGLFKAGHAGIALLQDDRETLLFLGGSQDGWRDEHGDANRIHLPDNPGSAQAVQSGKAVIIQNAMDSPLALGCRPQLRKHGIHTRVMVPLIARGQTTGMLIIDFLHPEQDLFEVDLELAGTVASAVAARIENDRLLNALDQAAQMQNRQAPARGAHGGNHTAWNGIQPDANGASAIDEAAFRRLRDAIGEENQEWVPSLMEDYRVESAQLLEELQDAAAREDWEAIRRSSHLLKSSSVLFGAERLAELCEMLAADAQGECEEGLPAGLEKIREELNKVQDALQARFSKTAGRAESV